jgi:hypothetical protein
MSAGQRRGEDREALREQLWPDSADQIWKGAKEKGYFPSPRNLPLILHLIREKTVGGALDSSSVYVELLHRDMGQGIVEILDEDEHAFCAGYVGSRAVRSWRERVLALQKAGFIKVFPKGNRKIGYVGIMHPRIVVTELRRQAKVPERWWQLFQDRQRRVGAPTDSDPTTEKRLKAISGGRAREPRDAVAEASRPRRRR